MTTHFAIAIAAATAIQLCPSATGRRRRLEVDSHPSRTQGGLHSNGPWAFDKPSFGEQRGRERGASAGNFMRP